MRLRTVVIALTSFVFGLSCFACGSSTSEQKDDKPETTAKKLAPHEAKLAPLRQMAAAGGVPALQAVEQCSDLVEEDPDERVHAGCKSIVAEVIDSAPLLKVMRLCRTQGNGLARQPCVDRLEKHVAGLGKQDSPAAVMDFCEAQVEALGLSLGTRQLDAACKRALAAKAADMAKGIATAKSLETLPCAAINTLARRSRGAVGDEHSKACELRQIELLVPVAEKSANDRAAKPQPKLTEPCATAIRILGRDAGTHEKKTAQAQRIGTSCVATLGNALLKAEKAAGVKCGVALTAFAKLLSADVVANAGFPKAAQRVAKNARRRCQMK